MTRPADLAIAREFGQRLARARRDAGLTQERLAEKAGLHPVTVSTLETASRAASVPTLVRVAAALDLDPAVLVAGIRPD
jgi:transcriptional regulator with XRE-family HTH domain